MASPAPAFTLGGVFRAQVPTDVDLEDRLLYGLTPQRLAILAGCVLVAAALARHGAVGWVAAIPVAGAGVALAWLRPRGRPLDAWVVAAALFLYRNRRIEVEGR